MKELIFSTLLMLGMLKHAASQNPTTLQIREERFKKQETKMVYPMFNAGVLSGVFPVENATYKPDPSKEVKLMFDFSQATSPGNQATKLNEGLAEVARVLNLHVAAGTPKEKIKAIVVFHAGSISTLLNDSFHQKLFQQPNPNESLLRQLNAAGISLIVCGQSLQLRDQPASNLLPFIQVAFSAKTTFTQYLGKGYNAYAIDGNY